MDFSDSDSGGSHISATPPRNSKPLIPAPPPPPPPSVNVPSNPMNIISRPRPSKKPKPSKKSKPSKTPIAPPQNLPSTLSPASLPFKILRASNQKPIPDSSSSGSLHLQTLPAGYFSKSAFFSKLQRPSFPSPDPPLLGSHPTSPPHPISSNNLPNANSVRRKHLNLIGANVEPSVPVKRQKNCVAEGNFVKLNMKGSSSKRKFTNIGRGKKSSACSSFGGRRTARSYRKESKRKVTDEVGDGNENGLCDLELDEEEDKQGLWHRECEISEFCGIMVKHAVLAVRNEASDENLVKLLKLTHGYDSFRDGQLEAIRLVLSRKPTMLVLPTGAGKSLCYQLPAIVLQGITLVVSPLVSLMIDQLKQLPPVIPGGILSSTQTVEEVAETLRLLQQGAVKVLFVSPERFLSAEFMSSLSSSPRVSLVVVDEAHCISEWSHNFRPSYMRLRASFLRAKLNAECILAMTATATSKTLHAVMSALEVPFTNLFQSPPLRDNLQLSVSISENRMKDLLLLIKSSPLAEAQSIIIYCKFQFETELVAKHLCDINIPAKCYHSGIPAKDRRCTQELFCSNKIRVVVATVAFGMGLDKRDVGAVLHYSLPGSLEEYVQEIGRAGRDGRRSYCHLLFDDTIYFKLRSLKHSDGVDEYAVNQLLFQVFGNGKVSVGQIDSLVKEPASRKFDMKEEVIHTLLTHLEMGDVQYLRLLPELNVTCTLSFHKTLPGLLAEKDSVVAAILKKSDKKQGQHVFNLPLIANSIGISTTDLLNQLHVLKLKAEVTYELKDPAYCYTVVNVPGDICSLAADLSGWLSAIESCRVQKLDAMFNAAAASAKECDKQHDCHGALHTSCLQRKILDYFNRDDQQDQPCKMGQSSRFLRADIKVFLQSNAQVKFTPRAVARIMHGIASPTYPSATWSRTHFWGRYTDIDFQAVMEVAKDELMNFVGRTHSCN